MLLGDYLNLEVKRERFVNDDGERDVRYLVDASQGPFLTQREVFIIAKILLASRSFDKEVVEHLINKLTRPLNQLQLAEHGANEINTLLKGERHYYRPVAEPTQLAVLETFLDAVYAHKKVIVDYRKRDGSIDKDYVFTPLSIEHFDYYWYVRGYKEVDTTKGR